MNLPSASAASRNLLKYGLIFFLLDYLLYEFVMEYFRGAEGFTLPVFLIGLVILGGGCLFSGSLTLRAWKESQKEAADAIDAQHKAEEE